MDTWAPLWSEIVDSSLWEESLEVRVVFLTMLAVKEADHVVRLPLRRLCKKANLRQDPAENARMVKEALDVLRSPDTKSVDEQEYEGRRIQEVEDGWLVLNGEFYQKKMAKLMARLRKSAWQREARAEARAHRGGPRRAHGGRRDEVENEPGKTLSQAIDDARNDGGAADWGGLAKNGADGGEQAAGDPTA